MFKIFQKMKQQLLSDIPDSMTPEDYHDLEKEKKQRLTTVWEVSGVAECTYMITGLPHEGGVGRCFLPVKREIIIPPRIAYKDFREYLIKAAREAEQAKLGSRGMIFGDWYDKPVIRLVRKQVVEDES